MLSNQEILGAKIRNGLGQLPHLIRALGMVWDAAPRWTLLWFFLLVIQGLLPVITVYLTRGLVNTLVAALQADTTLSSFKTSLPFVAGVALVFLLAEFLKYTTDYVRTAQAELVRDHIGRLIHTQSVSADLAFFDMPDYYDHLYRAQYDAIDRPLTLLESIGGVIQNGLTMVAMAAVLIPYGIWLPVALIASSLPALYIVLNHKLRYYRWRLKNTESERRTRYYNWLLTDREVASELRIFDLGNHFQSLFQSLRTKLRNERVKLAWDQGLSELGAASVALLITGLALAWMIWKAIQGNLTLGDLALFYQAFQRGQQMMSTLFENLGEIYSSSLFLNDLFLFLALKSKVTDPIEPASIPVVPKVGIHFEHVTFKYPGNHKVALQNFDLKIPAGYTVAIVGANGAGKSTLIKLLCRFFDPDEGRILLDGVDLRKFKLRDLRRQITILFQEPVHYQSTFHENIVLGDLSIATIPDQVKLAAVAAGADKLLVGLPQGYDTLLGQWFKDGTELSVGEWQRLALARAYWRQAPILILDEPTSAMDPWAEHDWLQRFRKLAIDRTTLIITHRFSTAMHADIIHVMEDGRIVESGNHFKLLALGGLYAQSWQDQVQSAQIVQDKILPGQHLAEANRPNGSRKNKVIAG
jgi:ATP-binding cassette subfamily B protein